MARPVYRINVTVQEPVAFPVVESAEPMNVKGFRVVIMVGLRLAVAAYKAWTLLERLVVECAVDQLIDPHLFGWNLAARRTGFVVRLAPPLLYSFSVLLVLVISPVLLQSANRVPARPTRIVQVDPGWVREVPEVSCIFRKRALANLTRSRFHDLVSLRTSPTPTKRSVTVHEAGGGDERRLELLGRSRCKYITDTRPHLALPSRYPAFTHGCQPPLSNATAKLCGSIAATASGLARTKGPASFVSRM